MMLHRPNKHIPDKKVNCKQTENRESANRLKKNKKNPQENKEYQIGKCIKIIIKNLRAGAQNVRVQLNSVLRLDDNNS